MSYVLDWERSVLISEVFWLVRCLHLVNMGNTWIGEEWWRGSKNGWGGRVEGGRVEGESGGREGEDKGVGDEREGNGKERG